MNCKTIFLQLFLPLFLFSFNSKAQIIAYSEPDNSDFKDLNFEIIGKIGGNTHIYKDNRNTHFICLYDAAMQQIAKEKLEFLPDRIINVDFLLYPDFYYLFYQYQKKSVVYCMATKMDKFGKKMGQPIQLDTTALSFSSNNKIYTIINSEDKQNIMLIKINRPDEKINHVTTVLFNKQLQLIKKSKLYIEMKERYATLSEFQLANGGDVAFLKEYGTGTSEIVNKLSLLVKPSLEDTTVTIDVELKGVFLDDIRLKIDNYNKHFLITSFYSKQKKGNVDGIFCYLWNMLTNKELLNTNLTFTEEFRNDAKSEGSTKTALNDYYLRNIVIKKDGGFVLAAEATYTSYQNNDMFNRWDGYGSPYSGFNNYSVYGAGGLYSNPFSRSFNNVTKYYADNIIMLSIDITGKIDWSNVIRKSQHDDNNDNFISYGVLNSGDKVNFIFNLQEKRQNILTNQSISPEGQIVRTPTIRGLDKGYEFMPRHAKQTGLRQIVVPCMYRNYICFSKIDF